MTEKLDPRAAGARRLKDKVCIVTGAGQGIGRAIARRLGQEGGKIVVADRIDEGARRTVKDLQDLGVGAVKVIADLSTLSGAQDMMAEAVKAYGRIDVLVNNAGIVRDKTIMKMTVDEWDEVMAVNLRGAFSCTKHAALAMRDQTPSGGHIIQIISASGLSGGFGQANYAASKAGMMGLLRTRLLEFSRHNIRTNAMWPVAQTD